MTPSPVIEANALSYHYSDGTRALDALNLRVDEGEKVAVIGPNGAGKSTFLFHLNAILRGEGDLRVVGLPVVEEHLGEIRQKVGLLFQDAEDQLFCPTVFEDVAFGPLNLGWPEAKVRERVEQALARAEVGHLARRHTFHLSMGEKKRVAVAAVLAMDPQVLVFDEPSSNLDPRHRRQLIEFMVRWERTLLVATHDLDLVLDVCERCILIDSGTVVSEGQTRRLLTDEPLLLEHGLELPLSLQKRA